MRLIILSFFMFASQIMSFSLYAAEPDWAKDSKNDCMIWNENPQPNETVTWSGNCVDGKAEGTGEAVWHDDGIPKFTLPYTSENGLTMDAGKGAYNFSQGDFKLELIQNRDSDIRKITGSRPTECGDIGYINVFAFAKRDLALWSDLVLYEISSQALNLVGARCTQAAIRSRSMQLFVYFEGDLPPGKGYSPNIQASLSFNGQQWQRQSNAWANFSNPQLEKYQVLLRERNEERAQQEVKSRYEAKRKALDEVIKRADAFAKKNGVSTYITANALRANPFAYQGKVVALQLDFSKMLTVDRGLFGSRAPGMALMGDIIVSGIPRNLFTVSYTRVVLAAKVLGNTSLKTPFGKTSVPHLRFVGYQNVK